MESQTGDRKRVREDRRARSSSWSASGGRDRASHTRHRGGRFQRPRTSCVPSLLDFAPQLLSKFGLSPSAENTENQVPLRDPDSPFRSPLHKSRRGLQDTTPHRSRRGPHHVGNHSSGRRATRMRRSRNSNTTTSQDTEAVE
ncbi:uncharacterized protein LOC143294192 [Babylonia areolata]|uniref:uncharacterized protein LOC143294192 n=1 Tax=Babylonia areolata TaxID=304850 RepID=UPI003FD1A1C2